MRTALLLALGAYLLGSIPFGLLIGLSRGVDVRRHGSRNIGATNVGRVLGRRWGYLCLALDILKGLVPSAVAGRVLDTRQPDELHLLMWLAVGVAAVLGHVFPIYLGFRGGKGVATTVGVALGIFPCYTVAMAVALLGYAAVRFATGIVSAGSLTLAVLFPASVIGYLALSGQLERRFWPLIASAVLLGLLIIARHRSNIARLLHGRERPLCPGTTGDRAG